MYKLLASVPIFLIVLAAQIASADSCTKDIEKFCKDVHPGGGRIQTCLKEHQKELSGDCREKNDKHSQSREEISDQCKSDLKKFCADAPAGKGRKLVCLNEHELKLSQECRSAIKDSKARK